MYLIGSLLLALGITVFAVSKIAEMLHAKKPGMERVLLASLIGSIAAFVTLVALGALVKDVDPTIMMILSVLAMFLVSTLAFRSINQMSWSGAITTNIANIALVLMTGTAAVVLNGESLNETIKSVQNTFNTNTAIVENIASGNTDAISTIGNTSKEDTELVENDDIEPTFKEIDLLPAATVKELEAKKNVVFKAPKYQVISLSNIRSAMGKNIRIKNTNGRSIMGALKNIDSNNLIIEQRINGGLATTPISMAKIQKLEVYR
ncbi:MAG: hypothetical protein ACI88H_003759 [Cocleimonas sp.]|jgi:hypothetical protein